MAAPPARAGPLFCAALRIEALALRRGGLDVALVGMRARRVDRVRAALAGAGAVAVAGVSGALRADWRPGDLVVAARVRTGELSFPCTGHAELARLLRDRGLPVHVGALLTLDHAASGAELARLAAATGTDAVDMESGLIADLAAGRPFAALRAIVDTPGRPLLHPATPYRGVLALRRLRAAAPLLAGWAERVKEVSP